MPWNTGRESHPCILAKKKNLHQHMYGISRFLIHTFDMVFGRLNKADHQIRWSKFRSENKNLKYFAVKFQRKFQDTKKLDKTKYSGLTEGAERHFRWVFWTKRIQIIGKVLGSMERQVEPVSLNIF